MAFSAPFLQTSGDPFETATHNPYQLFRDPGAQMSQQERILRDQIEQLAQQIAASQARISLRPTDTGYLSREASALGGQTISPFQREQRELQTYADNFNRLYKELQKISPSAVSEMNAIPILDAQGDIMGYVNPENPNGPIITRGVESADARLQSGDRALDRDLRRDELAQQERAQNQRSRDAASLRAMQERIALLSKESSELRAAVAIRAQDIQSEGGDISLINKQMDARIAAYKESAESLRAGIGQMSAIQLAELSSWTSTQQIGKDVFRTVMDGVIETNNRLASEENTDLNAAAQQRTARLRTATEIATAMHKDFKDSMDRTLWAPQEWWEQFQRGLMAVSAGKLVPRDVMQAITSPGGMRRISASEADPQYMQRIIAQQMGGDATVDNPAGSGVRAQRAPRLPIPEPFRVNYATRPDMDNARDWAELTATLGVPSMMDPTAPIPTITDPRGRVPSPTLPEPLPTGGFEPSSLYGEDEEDPMNMGLPPVPDGTDPVFNDYGEEAMSLEAITGMGGLGGGPFGLSMSGGGFRQPGEPAPEDVDNLQELAMSYLAPPLTAGGIGEDMMPLVLTTAAAVYNGWDPAEVVEELWAPSTGQHWTLHEENRRLQEELARIENEPDDDYGDFSGAFGTDFGTDFGSDFNMDFG